MMAQDTYAEKRQRMVSEQIEKRGVKDRAVLEAMRQVPRHLFIPKSRWPMAYADQAVYIGHGQTISQPYIVAFMTEALQLTPSSRVLEIGTGSGYQAAVLAELVDTVHTIEIVEELAKRAEETLRSEGYANVFVKHGDGNYGWKEHAPYDAIIATAAAEEIPKALMEQLNDPGRMIIPVGDAGSIQYLVMLKKEKGKISREKLLPVRFVPFVK